MQTNYKLLERLRYGKRATETAVRKVQKVVCQFYHITLRQMLKRQRQYAKLQWTWARQVAMTISVELELGPVTFIGRMFNRHHTTVLWAITSVHNYEVYPRMHTELEELRKLVRQALKFRSV